MKKKFWKRLISALLSTVLVACLVTSASAETVATGIQDEDLLINQEVAENIAELFVNDMVNSGQTEWNSSTEITDTKILYDEDGTSITGYSVELTSGYVVVSAYVDVPSIILEWADEAEPVYATTSWSDDAKVIYTGPMAYFLDTGTSQLQTVEGNVVARSQVKDQLTPLRDVKNVQTTVLQQIALEKRARNAGIVPMRAGNNQDGGYITDAGVYAQNVYGGTWTCTDWSNPWQNSEHYAATWNFQGYMNHCGPTAITNAIKMYGKQYNNNTIKNSTNSSVFSKVIDANNDADSKYYTGASGTWDSTANRFIKDSFSKYNVDVSVLGRYAFSLKKLKSSVAANKLMYIMLHEYGKYNSETEEWEPYSDHHVIGFAWSCMTRSSDLGDKNFVKICDGHNISGRYLELSLLLNTTNKYWEITF